MKRRQTEGQKEQGKRKKQDLRKKTEEIKEIRIKLGKKKEKCLNIEDGRLKSIGIGAVLTHLKTKEVSSFQKSCF
jgi:hypothetical protein